MVSFGLIETSRSNTSPYYPPEAHAYHRRGGLSLDQRADIVRLLQLGWKIKDIARECGTSQTTAYKIEVNLARYGSARKPYFRRLGRARKLSKADEDALFEYLLSQGWRSQAEVVWWLYNERGVSVNRLTVSRAIKRR